MIIVSQDRDTVINFDNIEILGIGNPLEDNESKFKILCNTTSDSQYVIAKYRTEERAKSVLNEIIIAHGNTEMIKVPKIHIDQEVSTVELIRNFCYCMPKN